MPIKVKEVSLNESKLDNKKRSGIWRDRHLYFMLVPFLLFYILFLYMPMFGLQIAFKDYSVFKGIQGSDWVGFENFVSFFKGPFFVRTLRNTILLNFYNILFGFPIPIVIAILLNDLKNRRFRSFVQTSLYLPHFISVVVVAGLVVNFLSPAGIVNIIIQRLGGENVYFMTKPEWFRFVYNFMLIWKESGFSAIIYISALCSISPELYEASKIDGAGKWKQIVHVTIPGIMPTVVTMFIIRIGNILNVGYETVILLYNPSIYETSDVISTYVFRAGMIEQNYGLATAVGLLNGVVALVLVLITNTITKKTLDTGL